MIICLYAKPRAGKSTYLARCAALNHKLKLKWEHRVAKSRLYRRLTEKGTKRALRRRDRKFKKNHYDVVYCTDPTIAYTVPITYEELGQWKPSSGSSLFLLEEAGIGLDNRSYKTMSKACKRFAAMHGHMGADIICVSQTADVDKAFRQRAQEIYLGRKLAWMTVWRRVLYSVDVNEESRDLVDTYRKNSPIMHFFQCIHSWHRLRRQRVLPRSKSFITWRPRWYKFFNSWVDNDYEYPLDDPAISYFASQNQPFPETENNINTEPLQCPSEPLSGPESDSDSSAI